MSFTLGTIATGVGGWDLGLQRAGFVPTWQCDIDPFCSDLLPERWAGLPLYSDANEQDWTVVEHVDCIAAGYPCQPFSVAGNRAGFDDDRNLWHAVRRAIRDVRPRYVLLENVRGHLTLGFDRVLGDLAGLGYDAEWDVLRASDFGAPHQRARLWVVAWDVSNPHGLGRHGRSGGVGFETGRHQPAHRGDADAADPHGGNLRQQQIAERWRDEASESRTDGASGDAADSDCGRHRRPDARRSAPRSRKGTAGAPGWPCEALGQHPAPGEIHERWREWHETGSPPVSPVRGVDDGVSEWMDEARVRGGSPEQIAKRARRLRNDADRRRLKALGNALVPDIAEWIGRQVIAFDARQREAA